LEKERELETIKVKQEELGKSDVEGFRRR